MTSRLPWFFCLLGLVAAPACPAQEKEIEIHAAIRKLDLEQGTLLIKSSSTGKTYTLNLKSRDLPVVNFLGQPVPLKVLKENFHIIAKVVGLEEVIAIKLEGPTMYGSLIQFDPPGKTLVLRSELKEEVKLPLADDVMFLIDKQPAKPGDFRAGKAVKLVFTPDRQAVIMVQAGKNISGKDPTRKLSRHNALLLGVDPEKKTMDVVSILNVAPLKREILPLGEDPPIKQLYQYRVLGELELAEIQPPLRIIYTLNEDTRTIEAVEAEIPLYGRRKVTHFDPVKKEIGLEFGKGERMFALADGVRVLTPTGEGKLSDIGPGRMVHLGLSQDRRSAIMLVPLEK